LPAAEPPAAGAPAQTGTQVPAGTQAPLDILLAEDNPANVYLVEAMLRADGHRIDVAADGHVAVERIRERPYDLVLMDVQMPGLDGYGATRQIRALEAQLGRAPVPVIVLSAHAFDADVRSGQDAGCTDHLSKPLRRQALRAAIARHAPSGRVATPRRQAGVPGPQDADWLARLGAGGLIDTAEALHLIDGDVRLYRRVLEHALAFLSSWSSSSREALARADRARAARLAHDLKGIAATIGAMPLSAEAARHEALLRDSAAIGSEASLDAVEDALWPVLVILSDNLPPSSVLPSRPSVPRDI
jgi:CheY-like chemotaxis protein/HPt (histidine-containing phosphotransfer) domain-containing protein